MLCRSYSTFSLKGLIVTGSYSPGILSHFFKLCYHPKIPKRATLYINILFAKFLYGQMKKPDSRKLKDYSTWLDDSKLKQCKFAGS